MPAAPEESHEKPSPPSPGLHLRLPAPPARFLFARPAGEKATSQRTESWPDERPKDNKGSYFQFIYSSEKKKAVDQNQRTTPSCSIHSSEFIYFFSFYNMGQRITANCFSLYTSTHKIYRGHVCTAQTNAPTMYTHFIACSQHTEEPQRGQRSCPPMNIGCHTRWQPAQGRYPIRTDSHWNQINRS